MMLDGPGATHALGERLGQQLRAGDVVTLAGPLGAGKTALARGALRALGFTGDVPSPSFPLVLPYAPPEVRLGIWHVDLYRIENPADIEALALGEALADGALLIEWPERLPSGHWPGALALALDFAGSDEAQRCLTARVPPAWEARWPLI